jgi:hypothetical protein
MEVAAPRLRSGPEVRARGRPVVPNCDVRDFHLMLVLPPVTEEPARLATMIGHASLRLLPK